MPDFEQNNQNEFLKNSQYTIIKEKLSLLELAKDLNRNYQRRQTDGKKA